MVKVAMPPLAAGAVVPPKVALGETAAVTTALLLVIVLPPASRTATFRWFGVGFRSKPKAAPFTAKDGMAVITSWEAGPAAALLTIF